MIAGLHRPHAPMAGFGHREAADDGRTRARSRQDVIDEDRESR